MKRWPSWCWKYKHLGTWFVELSVPQTDRTAEFVRPIQRKPLFMRAGANQACDTQQAAGNRLFSHGPDVMEFGTASRKITRSVSVREALMEDQGRSDCQGCGDWVCPRIALTGIMKSFCTVKCCWRILGGSFQQEHSSAFHPFWS